MGWAGLGALAKLSRILGQQQVRPFSVANPSLTQLHLAPFTLLQRSAGSGDPLRVNGHDYPPIQDPGCGQGALRRLLDEVTAWRDVLLGQQPAALEDAELAEDAELVIDEFGGPAVDDDDDAGEAAAVAAGAGGVMGMLRHLQREADAAAASSASESAAEWASRLRRVPGLIQAAIAARCEPGGGERLIQLLPQIISAIAPDGLHIDPHRLNIRGAAVTIQETNAMTGVVWQAVASELGSWGTAIFSELSVLGALAVPWICAGLGSNA